MTDKSDYYIPADNNRTENLTVLFCKTVFVALEHVFGKAATQSYLLFDSGLSSEMRKRVLQHTSSSEQTEKIQSQVKFPSASSGASDLFRNAYNLIFPRAVRHAQGEYYTPSWLTAHLLDRLQYCQTDFQTLLDPSCGSGTFLLQGLNRILSRIRQTCAPITAELFTNHLFGVDSNPISIFASKANLRINVFLLTGIVLPDELNNIYCGDFLKNNCSTINRCISKNVCYDVIAGNPPWIAWDNLTTDYRDQIESLWKYYNLFHLTGSAARYGGSKKDLSELFFYVACSQLKSGGKIGFLLPRSLLFNVASGGFRRWELPDKTPLRVECIEDYSLLNIFGTYAAKACCVYAEKGACNQYPVTYIETRLDNKKSCTKNNYFQFSELTIIERQAMLLNPSDKLSIWTVVDKNKSMSNNHVFDKEIISEYTAHLGVNSGGANGVFWLRILERIDDLHVRIQNLSKCSKKDVPTVETVIESALLYPLARWKSIDRRVVNLDDTVILMVQDPIKRIGLSRDVMEKLYPRTLDYLLRFESLLSSRAVQKKYQNRGEFYSMYNIGQYTFSDWKCVWRRMDNQIRATAVGTRSVSGLPVRPVLPQETCVFIPAESEAEAYYLSAMMNSQAVNAIACSSSTVGGKGFGSPNLLSRIPLKKFDDTNRVHLELSELEMQLGLSPQNEAIQTRIDVLATKLLDS